MASFGSELLAAALAGTAADEHPLRHVAELPPRSGRPHGWPTWAEPDVVRAFAERGIAAPWSHQFDGGGPRPRGPPRRAQHRHRVGQVAGLSAARAQRVGDGPAGPGAVPVADQGAGPRPVAGRARADRGDSAAAATSHPPPTTATVPAEVRRFARERSRWLFSNPDMIHLSILRNHARWAVLLRGLRYRGRRRMPLLPWCFRLERGDGAAPAAAAVRAIFGCCRR